jgi:antitoxin (DNA-binding transcriptional repressor) of toxin-antitoxin stability system
MTSIGSFDAQNLLPQLLARVAQGEEFLIIDGGKPVAKLVPSPPPEQPDVKRVIVEFKAYSSRQARTLGGSSFREMIDEGRRY